MDRRRARDELGVRVLIAKTYGRARQQLESVRVARTQRLCRREAVTWIVEQHGLFQTYYYVHHLGGDRHAREKLKEHTWYDACVAFCDWDQASFDPQYATRSLDSFEPLMRRIFSRQAHGPRYVGQPGAI